MEYECFVTPRGMPEMWRQKNKSYLRVFLICTDGEKVYITGTHPPIYRTEDARRPRYHSEPVAGGKEVYPAGSWMTLGFLKERYVKDC